MKAYAKINLALKVLGKRNDGFHNLEMIMVNVGVYDILKFKKNKDVIVLTDKPVCKMEDNIVYKTIMLIKEKYNIKDGVEVKVFKRIPDGGGMGGGSSDAACTIKALNKMWNLNMTRDDMFRLAEKLGSDVFFFIDNRLSLVKGRGEIVEPIDIKLNSDILLCFPNMKCSTKYIFENHMVKHNRNDIEDVYKNLNKDDYYKYLFNDLEETVCSLYPEYILNEIKTDLESEFDCKVMMSGSGSSFFVIGKNIKNIYKYVRNKYKDLVLIKNKTISYCKSDIK